MKNSKIDIDKIIDHWIITSDDDYETMRHLYNSKDYHWALFIGHIVIERLIKAIVVKKTNDHSPFTHDLRRLAKLSQIDFNKEHLAWLDTITTFNLNTRYDSYKQAFYKKCTKEFVSEWITKIEEIRSWIKAQL